MIVHVVHVFPLELRYKMNRILDFENFRQQQQCTCGWKVDTSSDLKTMYSNLQWDDLWEDAVARSVIRYMRGSKLLRIPADWRALLPVEL